MTNADQIRNSSGDLINPAVQEQQNQQDTHWQKYLTASGTLKAEESGKIVVLTDVIGYCSAGTLSAFVREKDAAGALRLPIYNIQNSAYIATLRQGIQGAAYDGSNAGDLYCVVVLCTGLMFTGYMKEI